MCGALVDPADERNHRLCRVANGVANKERPKADAAGGRVGLAETTSLSVLPPIGGQRKRVESQSNATREVNVRPGSAASKPTETERVEAWRGSNRVRYNKRERERMRLKRAGFVGIAYG